MLSNTSLDTLFCGLIHYGLVGSGHARTCPFLSHTQAREGRKGEVSCNQISLPPFRFQIPFWTVASYKNWWNFNPVFLFLNRNNGSLPSGDKGRKRSKYAVTQRPKPNGVQPSNQYRVQTPQTHPVNIWKKKHAELTFDIYILFSSPGRP